tara:strand:- start:8390 stop:9589 length:1200 start_codon:yes stop_codon:yes gene_type:complete
MATISITKRSTKTKGTRYRARVRITKNGEIIEKKENTLSSREAAKAWAKIAAKKLEEKYEEIAEGTYYAHDEGEKLCEITVYDLIKLYMENPITAKSIGRTKGFVLRALQKYDIAQKLVSQLTADDLIKHCETRLSDPTKPTPQTIYHDITYLHSVIQLAKPFFKVNANLIYHSEAIPTLVKLGLIGRSEERDKRPTKDQLRLLEEGLREREKHRSAKIPFSDILQFSIYTAMRVGEITELYWEDIDHENKTIIVRDRKNPKKIQNKFKNDDDKEKEKYIKKDRTKFDSLVPLLGEAYPIIMKQKEKIDPERPDWIFPYNSRSISAGWRRVRDSLGIEDLRYHDLRREAASRLIEEGYDITTVAKITGHKNINILYNIYTNIEMKKLAKNEFDKKTILK